MISLKLTQKNFWDNEVEGYIFLMGENLDSVSDLATLDTIEQDFYPNLKIILKKHMFTGKKNETFVLTGMRNGKLVQLLFAGVGKLDKSWDVNLEVIRRTYASVIQRMKKLAIPSAIIALPDISFIIPSSGARTEEAEGRLEVSGARNFSREELLKQFALVAHMANYEFTQFKSSAPKDPWSCTISIEINEQCDSKTYQTYLETGDIMGKAINQARDWIDLPGNIMTPTNLSEQARKISQEHDLKYTVFGREKALELGMGAFCAVDAGSDQDGKFVILEYHTKKSGAPTIALCGKGITFDTGGISLKPATGMTGMKYDMSGAAAVIATMKILAQLKPEINVIGLTPIVENMPSGKAARQDDVVTAMNGKSIEIKNTDAEGRLVLSDTLCYAEKFYKPDIIIDIATLTGACSIALGHFYTALLTRDDILADTLFNLGKTTGDRVWRLPLSDDYKPAFGSEVADVSNTSSPAYMAGTIVGGAFLETFVDKARWVHLDIASTAHDVPGINYVGKGSTGAGIRLLVEFVMNYHG